LLYKEIVFVVNIGTNAQNIYHNFYKSTKTKINPT
jgi:hypothetical protein